MRLAVPAYAWMTDRNEMGVPLADPLGMGKSCCCVYSCHGIVVGRSGSCRNTCRLSDHASSIARRDHASSQPSFVRYSPSA